MDVEVAIVPGNGKLRLTGTLGDVMKESAQAAVTYARSRSASSGSTRTSTRRLDVHIHIPEGATPKDGPSAGSRSPSRSSRRSPTRRRAPTSR
jgi:ATP-dependent Lon protease